MRRKARRLFVLGLSVFAVLEITLILAGSVGSGQSLSDLLPLIGFLLLIDFLGTLVGLALVDFIMFPSGSE